jgi:serine/threonine-protein kinase HipA
VISGNLEKVDVFFKGSLVGTLATLPSGRVAFAYAPSWLRKGFSISPLSLPLKKEVFIPKNDYFDGLFGVFGDSLPEGWGRLLTDRLLLKKGLDPNKIPALTRLSLLSPTGLGALTYEPNFFDGSPSEKADFDELRQECDLVSRGAPADFDEIFRLGGSSGGARPKVHLTIEGNEWIVKFPLSYDPPEIGAMEFAYNEAAAEAGLAIPPHRLFPSKLGPGYFGSMRFDRTPQGRIHVLSLGSLLEISHVIPRLDYLGFLELVSILTLDQAQVEEAFRVLCFNVYAQNFDDHAKNFSFIYDEASKKYHLSPSFDLTPPLGKKEHEMMVNGKGVPSEADLKIIAKKVLIRSADAAWIMASVKKIVLQRLAPYLI